MLWNFLCHTNTILDLKFFVSSLSIIFIKRLAIFSISIFIFCAKILLTKILTDPKIFLAKISFFSFRSNFNKTDFAKDETWLVKFISKSLKNFSEFFFNFERNISGSMQLVFCDSMRSSSKMFNCLKKCWN